MCKRTNGSPEEELATVQGLFVVLTGKSSPFFCKKKKTELEMLVSYFYVLHSFDEKEVGH